MTVGGTGQLKDRFMPVMVTWNDSASLPGWSSHGEIVKFCNGLPLQMESLGWLIYECETHIVLSMSASGSQAGDLLKIPRRALVSIESLSIEGIINPIMELENEKMS